MLIEVKVPQLSESVAEATLLNWHKKPGQYVNRDENLVDIETDKVVLETPAPHAGVLVKILKGDSSTVTSNEVIAQIDTEAAQPGAQTPVGGTPEPATAQAEKAAPARPEPAPGARAMPSAQKLAAEKQVDTSAIPGTGRGGRVTKGDVLQALTGQSDAAEAAGKGRPSPASASVVPMPMQSAAAQPVQRAPAPKVDLGQLGERPEERVPMSRLRARIAERLLESQQTNAILTTFNEVNMAPVMDLRNKYKDRFEKEHGVKLGFMSFFVKAAIEALRAFPVVNARIDENDIVYQNFWNIGVAVSTEKGLMVPVLHDADHLGFAEIEKAIMAAVVRAKEGKITPQDLTGGTFTIGYFFRA